MESLTVIATAMVVIGVAVMVLALIGLAIQKSIQRKRAAEQDRPGTPPPGGTPGSGA